MTKPAPSATLFACFALALGLPAAACTPAETTAEAGGSESGAEAEGGAAEDATYTYWRDAKQVIDHRCASCHRAMDIAPFSLATYEEVIAVATILPAALESGSMPPWPPAAGCNEYEHDRSLPEDERELLLTWIEEGAPEGDPADAPAPPEPPEPFAADTVLELPEPYIPTTEPDDNRCFPIAWTGDAQQFVTGFEVRPDRREIVHHVIFYAVEPDNAAQAEALDAEEAGPGYTCVGGTGVPARWIGSWVPGANAEQFPAGTGIRVDPGSTIVVQMHYNTSSAAPLADQSQIALSLSDQVERPLATIPFTDLGWPTGAKPMTIPAGDPEVTHSTELAVSSPLLAKLSEEIGSIDEGFSIHEVGLHMHYLGRSATLSVEHSDGSEACALSIPDWDFDWQGGYDLREPMFIAPDDILHLSCTWDNSPSNQPVIDGELVEPIDVEWGEGSRDEMCLGVVIASAL